MEKCTSAGNVGNSNRRTKRVQWILACIASLVAAPLLARASELPVETGAREVSAFLDSMTGLRMALDGGFAIEISKGTEIAGVLNFSKTKERPKESLIAKGFKRHGATLVFDGQEEKLSPAVVVAIGIKHPPVKTGQRFVLAMEISGECEGKARKYPLDDGGCSHWKTIPTEFDDKRKRVVARLDSSGGYRLQFGWLPE